ncbi:hypothetical protein FRC07_006930, partial [Ceratobasidium sp. 392]
MARATALVCSDAINTPKAPPELLEAKCRQLVAKIETEQVFDKVDAQLSEIHDAFLQHILLRHESNTTLDGFTNKVTYYDQACAYHDSTGQDTGVLFDEEELALARSGFLFGKSIFKSPETPLAKPVFRAAKFIHLVIKWMPKGDQTATPAMPIFDACVRVKLLFMVAGILPTPPAKDIHALIRGLARAAPGDDEPNSYNAPKFPQIPNNEPMALNNDPPALDDPCGDLASDHNGLAFGAAPKDQDNFDIVDLDTLIAQEGEDTEMDDLNLNLDNEDNLFVPPPEILPGPPSVRRNWVVIEDWDSDVEELDNIEVLPDNGAPDNGAPNAGGEENLQFHEDNAQQGINPDEELDMDNAELWEFLRQHLGDVAEEEWVNIFYQHLTPRNRKTL